MTKKKTDLEHHYGIGAVARLTGLTDHTIRVWERRYEAVVAERSANGRRQYTAADVEKLGLLKRLTDDGISIGQIAGDSIDELRSRAQDISGLSETQVPERITVAVLGDYLSGRLQTSQRDLAPLEILIADSNRDRFVADLRRHSPDVLVFETPILNRETARDLKRMMRDCGAAGGVIIYNFGATRDVDHARDSRLVVARAPVIVDEIRAAVIRAVSQPLATRPRASTARKTAVPADWQFSGPVAPRHFNQAQLATLASASTAIDCECPHHLAELVNDLSAFEIYSANCANRDDDDAALHRYLHQTTAQARALIEVALEKVAKAEGLEY